MAIVEVYSEDLTPESNSEELRTLPIFDDFTQDFYPNKDKPYENIRGHSVWRDVVEIGTDPKNAREYSTVLALPANQQVDTPILMTTAFLTGTHGHNEHTMLHMLDLGFPVILVGPEGEAKSRKPHFTKLCKGVSNAIGSSLPLTAQNVMEAFDVLSVVHNSESFNSFDDKNIILLGESRGAMIGAGLPAYAEIYGRKVIYADLTAPCFPTGFDFSPAGMVNMAKQGIKESSSIKGLAKTLTLGQFVHYPSTLNPNIRNIVQSVGSIPDLINGDAGMMAKQSALIPNIPMHITGFNEDVMCQFHEWKQIFASHPEVAFKLVDGAHLSIAAADTLRHIEERLIGLRAELVKNKGDVTKIDFDNVHLRDRDNLGTLATKLTIVK